MARKEEKRLVEAQDGKVLLVPNMEPYCVKIMNSVFISLGYNSIILEESDETLALGFKHTAGGECIPCPITTGALIKAMQTYDLPPEKVALFMPTACGPCRFGQYAKLNEIIFKKKGWDKIEIMSPSAENAYEGMPVKARINLWKALLLGDVFRKLACKIRPYEVTPGETDRIIEKHMDKMAELFKQFDVSDASRLLRECVKELQQIKTRAEKRPLVGIVGEIYVRSDNYINNDLVRRIEELGGEAWLAPFSEWIFYTLKSSELVEQQLSANSKNILTKLNAVRKKALNWLEHKFVFHKWEKEYYAAASPLLDDRHEWEIEEVMEEGLKYIPWQFEGEAILTLGRTKLFIQKDGAKAIVNASPMFCMPGTVTTSIFPVIEKELGVPIICNFYDGSGDPNKSLAPVMHYLVESLKKDNLTCAAK